MAHSRRWRQVLERTALVGLGLGLVAACELVVRLVAPSTIGAGGPPLYVRAKGEGGAQSWVLSPARRHWFPEQSFAARRPENGVLIFCVGGSDVYGYPYGAAYAFPSRLQRLLAAAYSERSFEVVNVGGMSYGSERLVGLVEELVRYHPDAIIVASGNNELVEADLLHGDDRERTWVGQARALAGHLALFRLADSLLSTTPSAVDAEAGSPFGIDVERREDRLVEAVDRQAAAARFRGNLELMVRRCRQGGVVPILCTVGRNLADWRPGGGTVSPRLDDVGLLRFSGHLARSAALEAAGERERALAELDGARALDPGYAQLCFRRGRLLQLAGRTGEAREELLAAVAHDATPIRALPEVNEQVRALAHAASVPLVDLERGFEQASPDGIPGGLLFLDYCHPNAVGQHLIATLLGPAVEAAVGLPPRLPAHPEPEQEAAEEPGADGFALWWLGNVALRQGRPELAARLLGQAVKLKPDEYRPRVALAQLAAAEGNHDEALSQLERAVRLAPQSVLARNALGVELVQLGRLDEAQQVLEQALELGRSPEIVHASLATVCLRRRDAPGAARHLDEAVRLAPGLPGAHRNLGLARLLAGDPPGAARAFLDELRRNPLDAPSAAQLERCLASSGLPELRAESARLVAALSPQ